MRSILKTKKGDILIENIIFIILNLVFLSILILFVFSKTGSSAVLEEKYAKQIVLIIDSAKPVMSINLEMEDAVEAALDEGIAPEDVVSIKGNVVNVRLREGPGYSYSFFNDVDVQLKFISGENLYNLFITEKEDV